MLKNYLKIAIKVLLRRKFFTFISLFGISFTLAFILVAVAFIDNTFGVKAPESRLDRTLAATFLKIDGQQGSTTQGPLFSYYFLNKYVKSLQGAEKISISSYHTTTILYNRGQRYDAGVKYCDSQFWEILDFKFLEGKPFTAADVDNRNPVVVINRSMQEKYFNGEKAVGKTMEIAGKIFTVIGVVENVSLLRLLPFSDIWMPVTMRADDKTVPSTVGDFPAYFALVLAKNRSDIPAIQAEFKSNIRNIVLPEKEFKTLHTNIDTYGEMIARNFTDGNSGSITPVIFILCILAVLFMVLPAINLVNINVSRIMERASEIGVRKAFGASQRVLIGQFILENIILTLLGGLISLVLTFITLEIINASGLISYAQLSMDFDVFLIGLAVALFFGVFSGLYPAWKMARLSPVAALKENQ